MKTVAAVVVLCMLFQFAVGEFKNPFENFKKLEGKKIQGRELPASFFDGINKLTPNLRKRQEFSSGCVSALEAVNNNPVCHLEEDNIIVEDVCEGACARLFRDVRNQCTGEGEEADIGAIFGLLTDIICLQDDQGNYCYGVMQLLETLGDDDEITPQKLDVLCSPCFFKLIQIIFGHPLFQANVSRDDLENANAFFDVVCTRADGKWCILTLENAFCEVGEGEDTNVDCLIQNLDVLCQDRCFKKILAKQWLFADPNSNEAKEFEASLKFACVRDGSDYCLAQWTTAWSNFNQSCDDNVWATEGCNNAECKQELEQFTNSLGCCTQTFLDFMKERGTQEEEFDAIMFEEVVAAAPCSIDLVDACPRVGTQQGQKKFYIRLTWSWAAQNSEAVRNAIRRDLAGFLGVPEEDVVISFFEKDNEDLADDQAGAAVEFTFRGQTNQETATAGSEFDAAIAGGSLTLPTTAREYADQGVLFAAGEPSESGSGAAELVVSTLAVFAAATTVTF